MLDAIRSIRNLENPTSRLRVDPRALRSTYLSQFSAFCRGLKEQTHGMGADYHRVSTAEPHEKTLLDYLASRARRGPGGGA